MDFVLTAIVSSVSAPAEADGRVMRGHARSADAITNPPVAGFDRDGSATEPRKPSQGFAVFEGRSQ